MANIINSADKVFLLNIRFGLKSKSNLNYRIDNYRSENSGIQKIYNCKHSAFISKTAPFVTPFVSGANCVLFCRVIKSNSDGSSSEIGLGIPLYARYVQSIRYLRFLAISVRYLLIVL